MRLAQSSTSAFLINVSWFDGNDAVRVSRLISAWLATQKHALADTLVWFASGVALAVAGIMASHFTHFFMAASTSSQQKIWNYPYLQPGPATKRLHGFEWVFHISAIVLGLVSLTAFVWGMVDVCDTH